jgi:hypothetical protein
MLKKSILFGLLLSTLLLGTAGIASSQEFIPMAMSLPTPQQDGHNTDAQSDSAACQAPVLLDRSGMDKASVHLQILQQTTTHFSDTAHAKKPVADDKKSAIKAQSNS